MLSRCDFEIEKFFSVREQYPSLSGWAVHMSSGCDHEVEKLFSVNGECFSVGTFKFLKIFRNLFESVKGETEFSAKFQTEILLV